MRSIFFSFSKFRIALFFQLCLFTLFAIANDTLTRAQVYDFSVGDTFDYRNFSTWTHHAAPYATSTTITFSRIVITGVSYSADSLIKYIEREQLFPLPVAFDTLSINNLSNYEVSQEPANCGAPITIASNSQYNSRVSNFWGPNIPGMGVCVPGFAQFEYVSGLGTVFSENWGSMYGGNYDWNDSVILIYYAKSIETWGTPYSNFVSIIDDPAGTPKLILYPNPATDYCTLQLGYSGGTYSAAIINVTGREMEPLFLNQRISTFSFCTAELPGGVYFVKVNDSHGQMAMAKLIKE